MKKIITLTGPSGCGKGAVSERLLKKNNWYEATSSTTRLPREGEVEGISYFFKTRDEFIKNLDSMIEHVQFDNHLYGVSASEILEPEEDNVVLVVEPYGLRQIEQWSKLNSDKVKLFKIYLEVTHEEQINRMKKRGDSQERIESRLANDNIVATAADMNFHLKINTELVKPKLSARLIKSLIKE